MELLTSVLDDLGSDIAILGGVQGPLGYGLAVLEEILGVLDGCGGLLGTF